MNKQVEFTVKVETLEPTEKKNVNYISRNGFRATIKGSCLSSPFQSCISFPRNGISTYQNSSAAISKSSIESVLDHIYHILEGQQKLSVEFNKKFNFVYTELNGKFEALNIHVKNLDIQIQQTIEVVKSQETNSNQNNIKILSETW